MEESKTKFRGSSFLTLIGLMTPAVLLSVILIGSGQETEEPKELTELKSLIQLEDEILFQFEELTSLTGAEMLGKKGENKYEVLKGTKIYQVLVEEATEEVTYIIHNAHVIYDRDKLIYEDKQ